MVLDAFKNAADPRVREILAALVKHLHAFARDVHLTEEEFEKAVGFITALGQKTTATHNEAVLMSGSLGFSTLICLLNNGNNGQTETTANLLGPFWRMNSPRTENGGSIVRSPTPGPALFVNCTLRDQNGKPIEGAEVDVWHSSPDGFYEQQDPKQADMNLRGKFMTDAQGHFGFRSVKPAGYPIPIDGPVGDAGARHRAASLPARPSALPDLQGRLQDADLADLRQRRRAAGNRRAIRRHARAGRRLCPPRRAGAGCRRDGRVVFARSDFRDGAGQKPAAQAANPVISGVTTGSRALTLPRRGCSLSSMNAVSSRPLPARPLALPNLLTYGRIAAVPVVVGLLYWQSIFEGGLWLRWVALAIFIAAGVTDILDGYLARTWGQQSSLGRMLDPIADKLLVASCLLMLAAEETIRGWTLLAAVIILCREILVSGLREFLAELRVGVPVTRLAKWKTIGQLVAIGFLIAGDAGEKVLPQTTQIGITLLWLSAILTLYTGWDYMRAGLRYMIDE